MKCILKYSFVAIIFITLFSFMVYGVAQQSLRLGANETPVQMSVDVLSKLESGLSARSVIPTEKVEISKSLSPWVIVLDQNKKVVVSSAVLNGQAPTIPSGVFDFVTKNGEDRITWQPKPGVRQAIIVNKYASGGLTGFVVAGRSLTETERLIDKIGKDVLVGWGVINLFAVISIIFLEISRKK